MLDSVVGQSCEPAAARQDRSWQPDQEIAYAVCSTAFGQFLLAGTSRGICFAMFGDDERDMLAALKREYPSVDCARHCAGEHGPFDQWIDAVTQYFDGTGKWPQVPLDLVGTEFQRLVWAYLLQIPEGQTVSYADVARGIGRPDAIRAAASACGRNRVAVFVPCHRVVRGDGGNGGFRWGIERKRALLDFEARR